MAKWYDNLTAELVIGTLGADHVAWILSLDDSVAYSDSRADGWWQANDPARHNAYASLARLIRAGKIGPLERHPDDGPFCSICCTKRPEPHNPNCRFR